MFRDCCCKKINKPARGGNDDALPTSNGLVLLKSIVSDTWAGFARFRPWTDRKFPAAVAAAAGIGEERPVGIDTRSSWD